VQNWDEILPNGYKTLGLMSPASGIKKRPTWDGSFPVHRLSVAKQLEADSIGYGANGMLICEVFAVVCQLIFFFHVLVSRCFKINPSLTVRLYNNKRSRDAFTVWWDT